MIHVHLDLTREANTLIGRIGLEGGRVRPFTGWLGLNAAIEELLNESPSATAGVTVNEVNREAGV